MTRRRGVQGLVLLWLALFAGSLLAFALIAPSGDGFTRGMNRLATAVGLQAIAAVLGVAAFVLARGLPAPDPLRRLVWVPLILAVLLVASMIAPFVVVALE